jgi:hypothetical protein
MLGALGAHSQTQSADRPGGTDGHSGGCSLARPCALGSGRRSASPPANRSINPAALTAAISDWPAVINATSRRRGITGGDSPFGMRSKRAEIIKDSLSISLVVNDLARLVAAPPQASWRRVCGCGEFVWTGAKRPAGRLAVNGADCAPPQSVPKTIALALARQRAITRVGGGRREFRVVLCCSKQLARF